MCRCCPRSSQEAQRLLEGLGRKRIDHLWLDHDLGDEDTIRPVVDLMVQLASTGYRWTWDKSTFNFDVHGPSAPG
jgi:hypothetical protein